MAVEETAPSPRSTPKVIWILLVVNLATLGASSAAVFLSVSHPPQPAQAPHAAEVAPIVAAAVGPRVPLEAFVVNLDEPGGNRYLKMQITIELQREEARAPFMSDMARIRDGLISFLSSQHLDDVRGSEGKQRMREGLQERLSELAPGLVRSVFLTDILIQ